MMERVRVRTNCSREQDFVILSCPLTNSDRPKFGPMRTSDELDGMHVRGWDAYVLLSWPAVHFSGCHWDWVGTSWWGMNGESRIPEFLGPQTPRLSLVIVYNFVFLAPLPHAVFLSLKSTWEGENAEHPCIVSSAVPAVLYIDMSCYYIYKYIYNFVRFLHLCFSQSLYFFRFCLSHFSLWVNLNTQNWSHNESGIRKE